jgi:tartrate/fumarate subfamily iron-sulfur-dependent hydro-lyase alpha chain
MALTKDVIVKAVVEGLKVASIYLPPDVKQALRKAYEEETNPVAKAQLEAILKNVELAEKLKAPICQDTGYITYYVRVGAKFPALDVIEEALVEATRIATKDVPLRPNTVDPFTGKNPGDNTGRYAPAIIWEGIDPKGDYLEVTIVPKGGGSEYVTVYTMVPPGKGLEGVKEVVLDAVVKAGAMPCPPTIIGVGIAGLVDLAVHLAKKAACVRKIGSKHPDPKIAEFEEKLLRMVNELGIGPMGMGGKTTALAVHVDYAYRHPATFAVAVAFFCWAARRATVTIKSNGEYVITQ